MSIPFTSSDTGTDAADTAIVITYAAITDRSHVIHGIEWSYSETPTGGGLTVAVGGTTVLQLDIAVGGPDQIILDPPHKADQGAAVVVTLAAGGGTAVGKLNVDHSVEV